MDLWVGALSMVFVKIVFLFSLYETSVSNLN